MKKNIISSSDESLLLKFNKRDVDSFCDVYTLFFNKLYFFAQRIFAGTNVSGDDVIQDVFISIWENNNLKFNSVEHIASYIYLSIRNRYKDYSIRKERVDRYRASILGDEEHFYSYILESETISIIASAIDILPRECAKVFKMYLEGWEIKDIATELNKSESTIYNQRKEAIEILKRKIPRAIFSQLLSIL